MRWMGRERLYVEDEVERVGVMEFSKLEAADQNAEKKPRCTIYSAQAVQVVAPAAPFNRLTRLGF